MNKKYDCLFIGNAIIDVVSEVSFDFLEKQKIDVGSWRPVSINEINELQEKMTDIIIASGGSAANSAVGFSLLGGNSAFIGRVKKDDFGSIYIKDLKEANVDFMSNPINSGEETGRCLVYVSPDAQRSMRTYLGAASNLSPENLDIKVFENSEIVYMEGYLWDEPIAKEAYKKAFDISKQLEMKSAFSLSDKFCVEKWRDEFRNLSENTDIVFGNEEEIMTLYDTNILSNAISAASNELNLCIITRGDKGSIIVSSDGVEEIPSYVCENVIDTTGAGDLFAAGFLYGLSINLRLYECAKLGSFCASNVINIIGPRPNNDLIELVKNEGLLT
tara:strand:- start:8085 stop:9077 length:993 start_codon:yes stop_codon:yes gene_type:complete